MADTAGFTFRMPGDFESPFFKPQDDSAYTIGQPPDLTDTMQMQYCEADQQTLYQAPLHIHTAEADEEQTYSLQAEAPQSAEALLLSNSLTLGSNNPYRVPDDGLDESYTSNGLGEFTNDFSDDMASELQQMDGPADYTPKLQPAQAQAQAQTQLPQMNTAMGAAFDITSFTAFANDSRPSVSSSRTHQSNPSTASHDTTATATTTAATATIFTQNALSDYSIFTGSYTSLLSANSANSASSTNTTFSLPDDDNDDEAVEDSDDGDLPAIDLLRNKDGTLGTEGISAAAAKDKEDKVDKNIEDATQWTDVAVPAALLEVPDLTGIDAETAPDLLRAILLSSVESVQAQVPLLKAAVASLKESRARQQEEENVKAALEQSKESNSSLAKKGKEVMTESTATLRPPPSVTTTVSAQQKKSKRQLFASTFRRLRGNNGESSSQGAAAASAAAAAMQCHNQMMAGRSVTPGFKWVRSEHGQQWELVPESADGGQGESELAVHREPGMAPISEGRRKTMLVAMVKQDMAKKKEVVPPQTIECISCFEDIPTKQAVKTVCHSYCLDCFAQLISTAVANEAQFPPKCCLNEIPSKTVAKYAPRDIARLYANKQDEFAIPVADRVYCPTVDCGVFVPKNQVSAAARTAHCRNGHETCTACRQPTHGRNNREACPEASAQDRRDQQLADNLAAEEGWRRCIDCHVMIEHRDACQHMTCRCGGQFCYVCGDRWHTCDCTMDDLRALKDSAAGRRTARAARERHEEELAAQADRELQEVRDALAQVEAFERRETERLAAERRVQRERLQTLKQKREAMLRIETESKYAALRLSLQQLTQHQIVNARQVRRSERVAQRAAHIQERRQLAEKQADERASYEAAAAEVIRQGEDVWAADYRSRLKLEKLLEGLYKNRVDAAAATNPDKCLRDYQRQNDSRLDDYLKWRDRELAQLRFDVEEARDVRAEVLDSLRRQHVRAQRAEQRALAQKHRGERVWCRIVEAERGRLLAEAEEVEKGLGLAGSTSETDTTLLMLLEMDDNGGFEFGDIDVATGAESNHMYAVMLNDMAGQMDGLSVSGDEWEDANDFYTAD